MDTSGGMSFAEVLALPGVKEHHTLRGKFGLLAYHGGHVERVTALIATRAALLADASVYVVDQPEEQALHIPSTRVTPAESPALAEVYDHVDTVCTIHGYGRDKEKQHVLIGGQNRDLAEHLAGHLDEHLDGRFPIVTDLEQMPPELRGVHPHNPANLPTSGGVQLELPPAIRWNFTARAWADEPGHEPTDDVLATIEALAQAIRSWP